MTQMAENEAWTLCVSLRRAYTRVGLARMSLAAGVRLGPYEIVAPLGLGGMGEVYRAHDTRLDRDVAIKVLPPAFTDDADRRARFEREAKAIASLSHPNILAIFDTGIHERQLFLVTELLDGESLRAALGSGALPIRQAIDVAASIARGLAAAHEKGIVHRDLKPENIFCLRDGQVKILDFGLAGHAVSSTGETETDAALTSPGTVLGTVGYMAPEQVRGLAIDTRTDLFALGAVLYELLSGQRAFRGQTAADTMTAILKEDPPELTAARADLPPGLDRIVRHCLEKNPVERFQTARDVAFALEAPSGAGTAAGATPTRRTLPIGLLLLVTLGAALAGGLVGRSLSEATSIASPGVTRFSVMAPAGDRVVFQACRVWALSHDGKLLAYIGIHDGRAQVYLRAIDNLNAKPLAGTEGVTDTLTFSPDGLWLAFLAGSTLKKVPIGGGSPTTLADTPGCGADWGVDDWIVLGRRGNLVRIPAAGGTPEPLLATDPAKGEAGFYHPVLLPGGKALLVTVAGRETHLEAVRLDSRERQPLVPAVGGAVAGYLPTGHLVYAHEGTMFAAPLDLRSLTLGGAPVPLLEGLAHLTDGTTPFSVASGSLVYAPGGLIQGAGSTLVWVDRKGIEQPLAAPPGTYSNPRLSPDGRKVALTKGGGGKFDIWIHDLDRATFTPLTLDGDNRGAAWTPDGTRVAYTSDRANYQLVWRRADGSGTDEQLTTGDRYAAPGSWSPDGTSLAFTALEENQEGDLWSLLLDGANRRMVPILQTRFNESVPMFSPDGKWLAYASNESGRSEIYVQPFPGPGGKVPVSTSGGVAPVWARNGRELFYRSGDRQMAVAVTPGPTFTAGIPRLLFEGRYASGFDVSVDATRFLMVKPGAPPPPVTRLDLVLNWSEEVSRRMTARPR